MKSAAEIEEIAATWLVRRESPQWTAQDQLELDGWLAESTLHEVTFLRLEHGWRSVDRLAALGAHDARELLADEQLPPPTPQRRNFSRTLLAAGIACVIVAAGVLVVAVQTGWLARRSYATEIGEHSTVPLPDGSHMELNTNTRLRASVDNDQRAVWLDKGEAYFDVAPDPARPFVVHAGAQRVTVLGTRFSVRRDNDQVQVRVVEGRVRVDADTPASPARQAIAQRGDTVVASQSAMLVTNHPPTQVEQVLSWRQGLLVFDQVSLADAVAEFNRYNRKQIIVEDPVAAAIPIGGRFEASNVDAFVRLIRSGLMLRVEEQGDLIRISN